MEKKTEEVKKQNRWLKLLSTEFLIIFGFMLVSIIVFAYAVNMVFIRRTTTFDERGFELVSQLVSPLKTDFMEFITILGKHTFLIPANLILIAFYVFIRKNKQLTVRITALALSSVALMFSLKLFFQRARPDLPLIQKVKGFSFPSGHALMSVAFYGLLIYIVVKEVKNLWLRIALIAFLVILIFLIGFSRIYLRVHYASDVMAGFAVGLAWLLLSLRIIAAIEKRRFARKALAGTEPVK